VSETVDGNQGQLVPFLDIAEKLFLFGEPRSPRLGSFELQFSDPSPCSSETEDPVSVSHLVHHLISELVEYLINPERAFVNRFVRLQYVRIARDVIFLDLFWHMKSFLDLL
jgi:hypothetical protein